MAIDPSTTAVVLIEYQNDFTSDGGVLHGAVEEVMDKTDMLANTQRVVDAARASRRHRDARADHVRRGLQRDQRAPVRHPQGRRRRQRVREGQLGRGHRRRPRARSRATSSSRASAASTRSPAPTSTSSCAARASPRSCSAASSPTAASSRPCASGYENGYQVITLNDCVAATSIEEHDNALSYDYPMFSEPMSVDRVHRPARVASAREGLRGSVLDQGVDVGRVGGVTQLRHRLGFDLADALAGQVELLADLFERPRLAAVEAEAQRDDRAARARRARRATRRPRAAASRAPPRRTGDCTEWSSTRSPSSVVSSPIGSDSDSGPTAKRMISATLSSGRSSATASSASGRGAAELDLELAADALERDEVSLRVHRQAGSMRLVLEMPREIAWRIHHVA